MDFAFHRERLARSIKARDRIERTGFTPNGWRVWTSQEDDVLRKLYPDYRAIEQALPGRHIKALVARSARIGVSRSCHGWKASEISKLRKLYPTASHSTLLVEFPGLTWGAIKQAARAHGIFRAKRIHKRTGSPLVDSILTRIEEIGWTLGDLDKEANTQQYFTRQSWRRLNAFDMEKLAKAVAVLDGKIRIDWN